jgi:hypothetical protein
MMKGCQISFRVGDTIYVKTYVGELRWRVIGIRKITGAKWHFYELVDGSGRTFEVDSYGLEDKVRSYE